MRLQISIVSLVSALTLSSCNSASKVFAGDIPKTIETVSSYPTHCDLFLEEEFLESSSSSIIVETTNTPMIFEETEISTTISESLTTVTTTTTTATTTTAYIPFYSNDEVYAISKTLAGECYDECRSDKIRVSEVILNRVSDGSFGSTVVSVLSADGQFDGYWTQTREISEDDISVAKETLTRWYNNDCQALSGYLYFQSGPGKENIFK